MRVSVCVVFLQNYKIFVVIKQSSVQIGTPDYDLLPVPAIHQILTLLKDVLESHDGAVAAVADKKENFDKVRCFILLKKYHFVFCGVRIMLLVWL